MNGARSPDRRLDIDWPAKASINGSEPLVDVVATSAQMLKMVVELTAGALRVRFREFVRLRHGLAEGPGGHVESLAGRK